MWVFIELMGKANNLSCCNSWLEPWVMVQLDMVKWYKRRIGLAQTWLIIAMSNEDAPLELLKHVSKINGNSIQLLNTVHELVDGEWFCIRLYFWEGIHCEYRMIGWKYWGGLLVVWCSCLTNCRAGVCVIFYWTTDWTIGFGEGKSVQSEIWLDWWTHDWSNRSINKCCSMWVYTVIGSYKVTNLRCQLTNQAYGLTSIQSDSSIGPKKFQP